MKRIIYITIITTLVGLSLFSCGKKCVCHLSGNSAQVIVDLKDNDHEFEMSDYDQNAACYSIVKAGNAGIEFDGQIYQLTYGNHPDTTWYYEYDPPAWSVSHTDGFYYLSTGDAEYHYVGDVICEERF